MKTRLVHESLSRPAVVSAVLSRGRCAIARGARVFARNARALARDDEGQAILEYVLLLSAALGATIVMARSLLRVIDNGVFFLGAQLEKDLKTGRMPASYWRN